MGWLPLACFSRRQGDRPLQKIAPCLWFDTEAVEAANFYVSVFKNSKIIRVARYPNEGQEIHGKGGRLSHGRRIRACRQKFAALNGGPQFTFDY